RGGDEDPATDPLPVLAWRRAVAALAAEPTLADVAGDGGAAQGRRAAGHEQPAPLASPAVGRWIDYEGKQLAVRLIVGLTFRRVEAAPAEGLVVLQETSLQRERAGGVDAAPLGVGTVAIPRGVDRTLGDVVPHGHAVQHQRALVEDRPAL